MVQRHIENKNIIIKNGRIITSNRIFSGDILVENDRISKIEPKLNKASVNDRIIDASGMLVFPGGIDPHVHFELDTPAGKSSDDFYTGGRAAIAGGTTTIIDFVTPTSGQSLIEAFQQRKQAAKKCPADYALHGSVTFWNQNTESEIKKLISEYGVTSFKTYMAYKDTIGIDDRALIKTMDVVGHSGGLVMVHCENGDLISYLQKKLLRNGKWQVFFHPVSRPEEAESEAVNRVLTFAGNVKCPVYLVHISTAHSLKYIEQAQKQNISVFAETCPHYLILDESKYSMPGFESAKYVISPPLRPRYNQEKLWEAINTGIINSIGTDHCPFNLKGQKDIGRENFTLIPNGAGSIGNRLSLLFTYGVLQNKITINQFVNIIATNPAKIFGLNKQKGDLCVGFDADIVIWNPGAKQKISKVTHFQNCDTNIYEGVNIQGKPEFVIKGGEIVFESNQFIEKNAKGKYIHRNIC